MISGPFQGPNKKNTQNEKTSCPTRNGANGVTETHPRRNTVTTTNLIPKPRNSNTTVLVIDGMNDSFGDVLEAVTDSLEHGGIDLDYSREGGFEVYLKRGPYVQLAWFAKDEDGTNTEDIDCTTMNLLQRGNEIDVHVEVEVEWDVLSHDVIRNEDDSYTCKTLCEPRFWVVNTQKFI